jgi:nucleoside-diphosphate-sugar epimerase
MGQKSILITGGSGFLGALTAGRLLARDPGQRIVLADLARHPRMERLTGNVAFVGADLSDPEACRRLVAPDVGVIFHYASLVSGGAERDFVAGFNANVRATINLLDACRQQGECPRFVFTSSLATFGGVRLPAVVDDWTHQHPQSSYGVAKVVGEQLLNEYSRKGYVDGRATRLPAIVVRDEPNTALSGFASALVREPMAGRDYICPVPPESRMPILNARTCVGVLVRLADLPAGTLGDYRAINAPSIAPSASEIADAVLRLGRRGMGKIRFAPDPAVSRIVAGWPQAMRSDRAEELGLTAETTIESIIQEHLEAIRNT